MRLTRSVAAPTWVVLALLLAPALLALPCGPASADVSSLDAYAGEAAVLGKPHHRHRGTHASPGASHRLSSLSGSSSGASNSGGSNSGRASRANGAATGTGKAGAPTRTTTSSSSLTGGKSTNGATPDPAALNSRSQSSTASSSLTRTDTILLIALAVFLIAMGILIRRLSRAPNPPGGHTGVASPRS